MTKMFAFIAAALVAVAVVADARPQRGIEFGRVGGVDKNGNRVVGTTTFSGKCEDYDMHDSYRGVTLSFPDSSIVLHADEMTWRQESNELVLKGTVRLTLDSK